MSATKEQALRRAFAVADLNAQRVITRRMIRDFEAVLRIAGYAVVPVDVVEALEKIERERARIPMDVWHTAFDACAAAKEAGLGVMERVMEQRPENRTNAP